MGDDQTPDYEQIMALVNVDIAALQKDCPTLKDIYSMKTTGDINRESKFLTAAIIANEDQYVIQDKVLMHLFQNRTTEKTSSAQLGKFTWRIVLPLSLRGRILKELHDDKGHSGFARTFERLKSRFYWPFYYADTENYVKSCLNCQEASKYQPPPSSLNPLPPGKADCYVNYRCAIDICGPYTKARTGEIFVLSYMEHATCYPFYIPLPDVTAPTIARALHDHILTIFGPPEILLSDLGQNLISEI